MPRADKTRVPAWEKNESDDQVKLSERVGKANWLIADKSVGKKIP